MNGLREKFPSMREISLVLFVDTDVHQQFTNGMNDLAALTFLTHDLRQNCRYWWQKVLVEFDAAGFDWVLETVVLYPNAPGYTQGWHSFLQPLVLREW